MNRRWFTPQVSGIKNSVCGDTVELPGMLAENISIFFHLRTLSAAENALSLMSTVILKA